MQFPLMAVLSSLGFAALPGSTRSETSPTACTPRGYFSLNCTANRPLVAVVAVTSLAYGVKPAPPQNQSCQYNASTDCLYSSASYLPDVIATCSGQAECAVDAKSTRNNCTGALSVSFSQFAFVNYQCINVGLLQNFCPEGSVATGPILYLVSNIYYTNTKLTNTTCGCRVTTRCGAQIIFTAIDLRLNASLQEKITFNDSNTSVNLTGRDRGMDQQELFRSGANWARATLDIGLQHRGKVWVAVQSTVPGAFVEVSCGRAEEVPTNEDHMCPTSTLTSPTTVTIPSTDFPSTAPVVAATGNETFRTTSSYVAVAATTDDTWIKATGIVVGILAVVLIVLLIVLIILLRRRRQNVLAKVVITHPEYNPPLPCPHLENPVNNIYKDAIADDPPSYANAIQQ